MNYRNLNNVEKGKIGEEIASKYLVSIGMEIICRNYRSRLGEIDIIGKFDDEVVFVEVKSRLSNNYGLPCESVDFRKVNKIKCVARYFISINKFTSFRVRFDVVEVYFLNKKINHIKNAF